MFSLPIKQNQYRQVEDYLKSKGFAHIPIYDDILDHLCTAIERKMVKGLSFADAFSRAKKEWGREGIDNIYLNTKDNLNPFTMFRNYLTSTWRNLLKQKVYTTINVLGLMLGIAAFITIAIYVDDEVSYDKFHPGYENIHRISALIDVNGQQYNEALAQFPMAEVIRNEYAGISEVVRINRPYVKPLLRYGEVKFTENEYFYVDQGFFNVFGHQLIKGDPKQVLKNQSSIILTEESVLRYFGDEDPIGKVIEYSDGTYVRSLEVTGVIRKEEHSHFKFDMLVPMDFQLSLWEDQFNSNGSEKKWFWTGAWIYAKFENDNTFQQFSQQSQEIVKKYFPPKWKEGGAIQTERIDHIHLYSDRLGEMEPNGSMAQVRIFSAIALVVLLIAVINYINLMSAQGFDRTKQIGVRKFLGALRSDIVKQFLLESVLLCLFAGGLALLITNFILLPKVNEVAGKVLTINEYLNIFHLGLFILCLIMLGVFAGIYPATFLSNIDALSILKGKLNYGNDGTMLRQTFVVIQFASSVILIVSVLVISAQQEFVRSMNTGFVKENILVLKSTYATNDRREAFKDQVRKINGVQNISSVFDIPGRGANSIRFRPEGKSVEEPEQLPITFVDYDFLETSKVKLLAGRFFDRSFPTDPNEAFILNKKAAELLGWDEEAVGKDLDMFAPGSPEIGKPGKVIGVIDNYNFESVHHPIRPLVISMDKFHDYFLISYKDVDLSNLESNLKELWLTFEPKWPMESFLLDQNLDKLYGKEEKLTRIMNYGMSLALIIAFIGIYGLSSYLLKRRTKEVGVRKVLGSSIANILAILSKDFLLMVLVSNILAIPLAYYFLNGWLQNFEYSISLSWTLFLLSALASVVLAVLASGYHTLKITLTNPVQSLRYE